MNTIDFLPLALDYHAAGGQIGARNDQIKYMNGFGEWTYHISLEDYKPNIGAPMPSGLPPGEIFRIFQLPLTTLQTGVECACPQCWYRTR